MSNPSIVFTKSQLSAAGWGENFYAEDNSIMVTLSKLRSKLGGDGWSEKIDFDVKNELDEIKNTFNKMSEKLAEADKIKQNAENEEILLFANMAHDLKTPITSIIGFSKALSDGIIDDDNKRAEYVATINSKAIRMNDLIDRLFEYVKLDSSNNQLDCEPADVTEILRNCIAEIYTEYEEKKIKLEINIPETAVLKNADCLELSRVYSNLLNNVIKHNTGNIHVLVSMEESGGDLRFVQVLPGTNSKSVAAGYSKAFIVELP